MALAGLLASLTILFIGMYLAVPTWTSIYGHAREQELVFRGFEIVKAIRSYQARANGQFPTTLRQMVEMKVLRREYRDPITNGEWLYVGPEEPLPACQRMVIEPPPVDPNQQPNHTPAPGERHRRPPQAHGLQPGWRPLPLATGGLLWTPWVRAEPMLLAQGLSPTESSMGGAAEGQRMGPFVGVRSRSQRESYGLFNMQNRYDYWCFTINTLDPTILNMDMLYLAMMTRAPAPAGSNLRFTGKGKTTNHWKDQPALKRGGSGTGGAAPSNPGGDPAEEFPQF